MKKELANGYSYKFSGSDALVDELTWLTITGPKGAKDFIKNELEL